MNTPKPPFHSTTEELLYSILQKFPEMASLTKEDINTLAKLNAIIQDGDVVSDTAIAEAINALKGNVPEAGNTLEKLYSIIQGLGNLKKEDIDTLAEINAILTDADFVTMADLEEILVGINGGVPEEGSSLAKLYNLLGGKKDKYVDTYLNTYFVSSNVTVGNGVKGDYMMPFTPDEAYERAAAGDTIAFMPGLYYMVGNMAKNGVSYTTFGGKALIVVGGINLFDYESLDDHDSAIVIDGDFEFYIQGGTVFSFKNGTIPRKYTIRWSTASHSAGTFMRMPAVLSSSVFEGNIDIEPTCQYIAIECGDTAPTTGPGVMNLNIVNKSQLNYAIKPWFSGFRFNISYIGTQYGLFTQPISAESDGNVFVLNIKQETPCVTYISSGDYSGSIEGGTLYLFHGNITFNGRLNNCVLYTSPQTSSKVTVIATDVSIINDDPKVLVLDGVWHNSTYECNSQSPCIMQGQFYNLQFNTTCGKLKISGYVRVTDDNSVLVRATDSLEVTGKLVANAPEVVQLGENGSAIISGYIKQLSTDGRAIQFIPEEYTIWLTLKNAVLKAGNSAQESILAESPVVVSLTLYGKSYSNKPIAGGAETNYRVGTSDDFIVDLNVEVSDD